MDSPPKFRAIDGRIFSWSGFRGDMIRDHLAEAVERDQKATTEEETPSEELRVSDLNWKPFSTARKDRHILARGPSGMNSVKHRYVLTYWSEIHHAWLDHGHDNVLDGGEELTEWVDL